MKLSGLSRPNLYLDLAHGWRVCGNRRFEVQFERLTQIGQGLLLSLALTGDIYFQTLGDKPIPLTPDSGRETDAS